LPVWARTTGASRPRTSSPTLVPAPLLSSCDAPVH
jgi:hypothetical protein